MKKFYITTSIAYANAAPHIGFALESIQADVLARYHRNIGDEVFFLTGTDEHGIKNFRAAQKAGKNPQDFVDGTSEQFKALKNILNLSWDDFIRTTDQQRHWPGATEIWKRLEKNGDIEKRKFEGLYCIGCEAFKTPKDLVDGKCPEHLVEPELVEEENYFFKLSKYVSEIELRIKNNELRIIPESRKNEILSFINQGVNDISISRAKEKLPWGIPVPGDDSQVMYVWVDALPNYISGLGFGTQNSEKFDKFWPADVHCIGKDIVRFHAVIWPGILLSAGLEIPKNIFVHGYITSSGQKMSKSLGNVISPVDLVNKYGTDAVRYYLLREIPSTEDGDFSEEKFLGRYNGELVNGLGNVVSRLMKMSEQYFPKAPILENGEKSVHYQSYEVHMDEFNFHKALVEIWASITKLDQEINRVEPFKLIKINPEEVEKEFKNWIFYLKEIALMLSPFLPDTSEKILKAIEENKKPENLFPRIS